MCDDLISCQHAHAAEHLLPYLKSNSTVLDVGSGSGYLCAIFHHLLKDSGSDSKSSNPGVVGIDHVESLVKWSVDNLKKDGLEKALESEEIIMDAADGREGYKKFGKCYHCNLQPIFSNWFWFSSAKYSAIHVGAAAKEIPEKLTEQLSSPGRLYIPIGPEGNQNIVLLDKDIDGHITKKSILGVRVCYLQYSITIVWQK